MDKIENWYHDKICIVCKKKFRAGTTARRCQSCQDKYKADSDKKRRGIKRNLIRSKLLDHCIFCEKKKELEIHHIDLDQSNNNYKNLIMICVRCHRRLHSKIYRYLLNNYQKVENKTKEE